MFSRPLSLHHSLWATALAGSVSLLGACSQNNNTPLPGPVTTPTPSPSTPAPATPAPAPTPAPEPSPTPAPTPAPAPTPTPAASDFPPAEPGQGVNGGGFAVARYLAPLAGSYVFNCQRTGSGSGAVSPRLTINSDGTAVLDGITVSPNTRSNWSTLIQQQGRPGTGTQNYTLDFVDRVDGVLRTSGSLNAMANVDGSGLSILSFNGSDATSPYDQCTASQIPASIPAFEVRRDLVPRAGSYEANCVKRSGYSSGVIADGVQRVRISRAGVIKLGSFKLPYSEITARQYSEMLSGTPTFSNSALLLSTASGSSKNAGLAFNAYDSTITSFTLNETDTRATVCTVTGFSATDDAIEPTDDGGLPAGVQTITAGISSALAGDYALNCDEAGTMVSRTASIAANGRSTFAGSRITDVSEGTGTLVYNANPVVNLYSAGYSRSDAFGTLPEGTPISFSLGFNRSGQVIAANYATVTNRSGFICTVASGTASSVPGGAAALGASLARSEMLDCTRRGSSELLPTGATSFSIGSDGTFTLGSLVYAPADYQGTGNSGGLALADSYAYNTRAPGTAAEIVTLRRNGQAMEFLATEDSQRNTDSVVVTIDSSNNTTCRRL